MTDRIAAPPRLDGAGPIRRADLDIAYVLAFFLASRIALEIVGVLSVSLIRPFTSIEPGLIYSDSRWLEIWGAWDAGWFLGIARDGYDSAIRTAGPGVNVANWPFFPAYPGISAALAWLTGLPVFAAMLVVSNVSFLGALFLIRIEAEREFGLAAARATVALFCVMPGAHVFSSAYSESLFLFAVALTFVLVRRRLWLAAGLAAGLATLTRNMGIALVLPMLVIGGQDALAASMAGQSLRERLSDMLRRSWPVLLACCIPVMALLGFCLHLYLRTGDPLAFVTIQARFGKTLRFPLDALTQPFRAFTAIDALNWIGACVAVAMLVPLALWRRWHLFVYAVFVVVLPLSSGLVSFNRYLLTMLPVVMAAGALCGSNPTFQAAAVPALATLSGLFMVGWSLDLLFVI